MCAALVEAVPLFWAREGSRQARVCLIIFLWIFGRSQSPEPLIESGATPHLIVHEKSAQQSDSKVKRRTENPARLLCIAHSNSKHSIVGFLTRLVSGPENLSFFERVDEANLGLAGRIREKCWHPWCFLFWVHWTSTLKGNEGQPMQLHSDETLLTAKVELKHLATHGSNSYVGRPIYGLAATTIYKIVSP